MALKVNLFPAVKIPTGVKVLQIVLSTAKYFWKFNDSKDFYKSIWI